MNDATEAACRYYDANYDVVFAHLFERSEKLELGDATHRLCRFCGKSPPEVTFDTVAHAIPEALGNRGLTSTYECDICNSHFGRTIENDLGEWSKPTRTFARIRGKNGVPTLKKGSNGGWRIEHANDQLQVKVYEDDPIFVVDEAAKRVIFTLKRGTYTPVAVLKAFVKIGLTLMPEAEMNPFGPTLAWIREADHSRSWVGQATVIHTFQNGPMPNDHLTAFVLRRKSGASDVPYAFLILGYGNDVFQVMLPVPEYDQVLDGKTFQLVAFPTPGGPDPERYGRARPSPLDLSGRDKVRGETTQVAIGYERRLETDKPGGSESEQSQ